MKCDKVSYALRDALLDKDDKALLLLSDADGKECHYKQIATIKKENTIYCILKPLNSSLKRDEAMLFRLDDDCLIAETSNAVAGEIFNAYERALKMQVRSADSRTLQEHEQSEARLASGSYACDQRKSQCEMIRNDKK